MNRLTGTLLAMFATGIAAIYILMLTWTITMGIQRIKVMQDTQRMQQEQLELQEKQLERDIERFEKKYLENLNKHLDKPRS